MASQLWPCPNSPLDLTTGAWERKHGQVLTSEEMDLGYRLVVASVPSNKPLKLSVSRGRPPAA